MISAAERQVDFYTRAPEDQAYPTFSDENYRRVFGMSTLLGSRACVVLDAGSGTAHASGRLKAMGHRIIGVDVCGDALARAKAAGRIDEAVVGDVCATGLPDASVDVALCWTLFCVLPHDDTPRRVLAELTRVVRPGGEILVIDMHRRNPYAWIYSRRPKIIDRWLLGNVDLIPLNFIDDRWLAERGPSKLTWAPADYPFMFSEHRDKRIQAVHAAARAAFGLIRLVTKRPWTGNYVLARATVGMD